MMMNNGLQCKFYMCLGTNLTMTNIVVEGQNWLWSQCVENSLFVG